MSDFKWTVLHTVVFNGFSCTPARLSKSLGLSPTFSISRGEVKPPRRRPAQVSIWNRTTKEWKGGTHDINGAKHLKALARLAETIAARRRSFAPFLKSGEIYFKTEVYTDSPNVIAFLPLEIARAIASLGAVWYCSVWSPKQLAAMFNRGATKAERPRQLKPKGR